MQVLTLTVTEKLVRLPKYFTAAFSKAYLPTVNAPVTT